MYRMRHFQLGFAEHRLQAASAVARSWLAADGLAGIWLLLAAMLAGCGEDGGRPAGFSEIEVDIVPISHPCLAWGDYDGDGDLDLAVAGFHKDSLLWLTSICRNEAGQFTDVDAGLAGVDLGSLAWGDFDSDGDLDLAVFGVGLDYVGAVYRNQSGTSFEVGAQVTGAKECAVAWGDHDNDGDLDIVVAGREQVSSTGSTRVCQNDGSGFGDISAGLEGVWRCSVAWGDYDNDGDLDLALAGTGESSWGVGEVYSNEGGGAFTNITAGLTGVSGSSIAWGDYDNDGDLDLALAGWDGSGFVSKIYRNDAGDFADIAAGLKGVSNGSLAWGDCDNDGDLDLALAGYTSCIVYRNDGGGSFADIEAGLEGVSYCALAWGDYDSDGDLDLLVAGYVDEVGDVIKLYRNNCWVSNAPPTAPCALGSTVLGTDVILSWCPATDAETPAPGLSYNLRVRDDSGGGVMPGMADDATGYRRVPALGNAQKRCYWILKGLSPGTYYWSVQAIDTAFAGSPWATEETVTVP